MNAWTALANLESLAQPLVAAWPVFMGGMACGLSLGLLAGLLLFRRRRRVTKKPGVFHSLLAITPAVVACLLWGLWLGIMAAKSLAP